MTTQQNNNNNSKKTPALCLGFTQKGLPCKNEDVINIRGSVRFITQPRPYRDVIIRRLTLDDAQMPVGNLKYTASIIRI